MSDKPSRSDADRTIARMLLNIHPWNCICIALCGLLLMLMYWRFAVFLTPILQFADSSDMYSLMITLRFSKPYLAMCFGLLAGLGLFWHEKHTVWKKIQKLENVNSLTESLLQINSVRLSIPRRFTQPFTDPSPLFNLPSRLFVIVLLCLMCFVLEASLVICLTAAMIPIGLEFSERRRLYTLLLDQLERSEKTMSAHDLRKAAQRASRTLAFIFCPAFVVSVGVLAYLFFVLSPLEW